MINIAAPGTIDKRALNLDKPLSPIQIKENLNLCINSVKAIGLDMNNITPEDFVNDSDKVIRFLWQTVEVHLKNYFFLVDYNLYFFY